MCQSESEGNLHATGLFTPYADHCSTQSADACSTHCSPSLYSLLTLALFFVRRLQISFLWTLSMSILWSGHSHAAHFLSARFLHFAWQRLTLALVSAHPRSTLCAHPAAHSRSTLCAHSAAHSRSTLCAHSRSTLCAHPASHLAGFSRIRLGRGFGWARYSLHALHTCSKREVPCNLTQLLTNPS